MSTDVKIVDELIDHFLVQAKRYGDATLDPDLPDSDFSTNCRMGQQSATIAFLAGQLWVFAPGLAEGAVKRVVDMVADGHELFDWAAAELVERRVDVAAVTAGQLESEAWLKRVGESAAAAAAGGQLMTVLERDYSVPIVSGLTPQPAGTGQLSAARASQLADDLRQLQTARDQASAALRAVPHEGEINK